MAASYGSAIFVTPQGEVLYKDIYLDDSAGAPVNFDGGSGASTTSPEAWTAPGNCRLVDLCIASATGQTKTQVNINDRGTGTIVRNALHLSTVTNRPRLGTTIPAGAKVTMIQLA